MTKRIQKFLLAVAALAALALGGSVFAQAQTAQKAAPEKTTKVDLDNVQSGDQTTPDTTASKTARHHTGREATSKTDGDTVQSGDQTTPDTSGATSETSTSETSTSETSTSETGGETTAGSDGPGGHADAPGSAGADHQFQGTE